MKRPLIALTLSATLALSSLTPAPAQAGNNDDVAKVIAGVAALIIIGKAIDDHNKRKQKKKKHKPQPTPKPPRHEQPRPPQDHWDLNRSQKRLPGYCLRHVSTQEGERRIYGKRCLRQNYYHADLLPRRCLRKLYTDRGIRKGYAPRCLRKNGFSRG